MLSALIAYRIVTHGDGRFTAGGVDFLLSVAALPLARWVEFRRGDPQKAEAVAASYSIARASGIASSLRHDGTGFSAVQFIQAILVVVSAHLNFV